MPCPLSVTVIKTYGPGIASGYKAAVTWETSTFFVSIPNSSTLGHCITSVHSEIHEDLINLSQFCNDLPRRPFQIAVSDLQFLHRLGVRSSRQTR